MADSVEQKMQLGDLPPFTSASNSTFAWGPVDGKEFSRRVDTVYEIVVFWRRNLFVLPSGAAGKRFIGEKTRLFGAAEAGNPMEKIALKAALLMEHLLLQKPHKNVEQRKLLVILPEDLSNGPRVIFSH